jgi:hypothetical protein
MRGSVAEVAQTLRNFHFSHSIGVFAQQALCCLHLRLEATDELFEWCLSSPACA